MPQLKVAPTLRESVSLNQPFEELKRESPRYICRKSGLVSALFSTAVIYTLTPGPVAVE